MTKIYKLRVYNSDDYGITDGYSFIFQFDPYASVELLRELAINNGDAFLRKNGILADNETMLGKCEHVDFTDISDEAILHFEVLSII
jgi:hypothetical protein